MKNKLKIIHSITRLDIGGAQKHLYELIKNFNCMDTEHIIITGRGGYWFGNFKKLKNTRIIVNPFLIRKINPLFDFLAVIFNILIFFDILSRKKIIIHSQTPKAGLIIRWSAFLSGYRNNIFTIHGWDFYDEQNYILKNIIIKVERLTAKITKYFISVCMENIKLAKKHKIIMKKNYKIIYGGFDYDTYFKKKRNNVKEINTIGTVINFKKMKKMDEFIYIALKLLKYKKLRFIIIGDGPSRIKYEKAVKEYKDSFEFTGFLSEPYKKMIEFDMLLFTSHWEGMPRVLIESYLLNIPFLAYNAGGIKEFAHAINAEEMVIDNYDKDAMFKKTLDWLKNGVSYRYRKMNCFSLKIFINKHEEIYKKISNILDI